LAIEFFTVKGGILAAVHSRGTLKIPTVIEEWQLQTASSKDI